MRTSSKGFSTLELMIAFALMSIVFAGVILAHFGASYWSVAAETSNEGLYTAKTELEELRAVVKKDFRLASTSPEAKLMDSFCSQGGLCYYARADVADLSPCSKYVTANVSWQVQGYPTTTTSLFTNLTDAAEAIRLGGDCPLTTPAGVWAGAAQSSSADIAGGVSTGIDTLGGVTYIASSHAPYLSILNAGNFVSFANSFAPADPLNSIDVARDLSTGRTYGYAAVASTTVQLEIFDLTDPNNPVSVSKLVLTGVDKNGSFPQGLRAVYYDRKIYIATRETTGPEFHIIDVSNPAGPVEVGSRELNTSAYGIVVRDFKQGNTTRRLALLSTSDGSKGLMVLDVTSLAGITEMTGADTVLPNNADGRSIFLSGNTIYIGTVSNSGKELYSLNASNIFNASAGLPVLGAIEAGGDIIGIRVSDPYVFVANGKSGGQLNVYTNINGVLSSTPTVFPVAGLAGGIDMEGKYIYAASQSSPRVRVIQSN